MIVLFSLRALFLPLRPNQVRRLLSRDSGEVCPFPGELSETWTTGDPSDGDHDVRTLVVISFDRYLMNDYDYGSTLFSLSLASLRRFCHSQSNITRSIDTCHGKHKTKNNIKEIWSIQIKKIESIKLINTHITSLKTEWNHNCNHSLNNDLKRLQPKF